MTYFLSLLKDNTFRVIVLLVTIGSFGFAATNLSIGIDDFGTDQYMSIEPDHYRNMLQQGRLLHLALFYLTGLADVVPFLNAFLAAALFALSATALCALVQKVSDGAFTSLQLALAASALISYPIIAFKFIYELDVVLTMLAYLTVPMAIYFILDFFETRSVKSALAGFFALLITVSGYESFNEVFVVEVLFLLAIAYVIKKYTLKEMIIRGLVLAAFLVVTLAVYYVLVAALQHATGNPPAPRASIFTEPDLVHAIAVSLVALRDGILLSDFQFAQVICGAMIGTVALSIFFAVKEKKPLLVLMAFGILGAAFVVQFVQGTLYYRTCQALCIILFFVILVLLRMLSNKKALRIVSCGLVVLLTLCQMRCLNQWFYKDWVNYEKNVYAINTIATDLVRGGYDTSKPLCFIYRDYNSFLQTWDEEQQEIGESPLIASVAFCTDDTSSAAIRLFKMQGYDFIVTPTVEQSFAAKQYAIIHEMPAYPVNGYIAETDEFIIVHFGMWYEDYLPPEYAITKE